VPPQFAADSFTVSDTLAGFVDLDLGSGEQSASGHVLSIARLGETPRPIAHVDLGGYFAVDGQPFCDAETCLVVGTDRYGADHQLRAWALGADGTATEQILSAGSVAEATTVASHGTCFALFVDGEASTLNVARWSRENWEAVGRIDGVEHFSASPDGDGILVAWTPGGGSSWRFAVLQDGRLGAVSELGSVSARERLVLRRTERGLAAAAYRLEQDYEHPSGEGRQALTSVWTLVARFGASSGASEPAFSAPLEIGGEGLASHVALAPVERAGGIGWLLQYHPDESAPPVVTRLLAPEACREGGTP